MKKVLIILAICSLMLTACGTGGLANQNTTTTGPSAGTTTGSTSTTASTTGVTEANNTSSGFPAASTSDITAPVSDYFPFTPDIFMSYKGTGNEYASYETYVDYIRGDKMQIRKNNGGTEAVLVYAVRDGKLSLTYTRGEIYYKYDFTAMSGGEDVLLMEPLTVGTAWTAKDGSPRSITSVDTQVETPAGKFTAIEVTTKSKDSTIKDYYAKGAGLVKTVFSTNGEATAITSELEKVEKDVPYTQTMNFYYPQFNNDRIVYMERDVDIKTNEDMKFKFQKELKIIPETGGLAKTLTKNTKVLGIKVDEDKGIVTVDLSSDFIQEMNAGSGFELMLLDSIVNTFGNYYLKGKVIITIEGKPYESGHVLMKPGETFTVKSDEKVKFEAK